jgi:hypothetical protein
MKKTAVFVIFLIVSFACAAAMAEEIPNLVGTWNGKAAVHHRIHGFKPDWHEKVNMIIEEQEGRFFYGHFLRTKSKEKVTRHAFSGVIMKNGKQGLITWHSTDGITLMEIEGPDRLTNYGAIHDRKHAFVTMTEYTRAK